MSMTKEELVPVVEALGEKKFRAAQLFTWMSRGEEIDGMNNLSKSFREKLKNECEYRLPKIVEKYVSAIDGTVKYLFSLIDGAGLSSIIF